jgi:hypothetical protein
LDYENLKNNKLIQILIESINFIDISKIDNLFSYFKFLYYDFDLEITNIEEK